MTNQLIALLLMLSILTLMLYMIDKWLAKRRKRRISEMHLLIASFLGPLGAIFGVITVRHKSKKPSYLLKLGLVLTISIVAWSWLIYQTLS